MANITSRTGEKPSNRLTQRVKGKLLSSHIQRQESIEKQVTSLIDDDDSHCWAPKLSTAFMTLLSTRYCSALWSNISDCDETFNYWEPTHYLIYGSGFQTWEYSPKYAIRSYAYLLPHALPGIWQKHFHGKEDKSSVKSTPLRCDPWSAGLCRMAAAWSAFDQYTFDKATAKILIVTFYLIRVVLALLCAAGEVFFYRGVKKQFGNHVARIMLFCLVFGSGMHISASAFLPSSFAMVMIMLAYGGWFIGDYSIAIFFTAAAALVGWPFTALLGVPIAWDLVLRRRRFVYFIQWSLISFVSLMCPLVYFDSHYYGKTVFTPFNIIRYNILGKGGPNFYGTEPWTYYFINGFLNFNVIFLLALVSLPIFMIVKLYSSRSKGKAVFMPPRVLLCLVGLYLWILVFFTRPHKEERFLFPVYPIICLAGAVALSSVESAYRFFCKRIQIRLFGSHWIAIGTLLIFALLSVSRSLGLYIGYHAPLDVYLQLNHLNINTQHATQPSKPAKWSTINLCVGKEWYRYPSSFFLPDRWELKFIRSEFRAQLPKPYSRYPNATRTIPSNMNDENKEEKSRYVAITSCHYLVDLVSSRETAREPNYSKQEKNWEVVVSKPFLDSSRSPSLYRAFYVPLMSSKYNIYANYTLLKSKTKLWEKEKIKRPSLVHDDVELDDPEEFEGITKNEENDDEFENY